MPTTYKRTDRISDVLKKELAEILSREVKDPRLNFITITHVEITRDLKNAKVFFSSMQEGTELREIHKSLKHAAGFVQRKLGARIHLRYTPHITFVYDHTIEYGSHMNRLLKDIEDELKTSTD